MRIKLFFWSFALLTVIVQFTLSASVAKEKGGNNYKEEIEIDNEKKTETFHVPKTSPIQEAGDIIYDFKRKVTMIHLPERNACYATYSTDGSLKPVDLLRALDLQTPGTGQELPTTSTGIQVRVVGMFEDLSGLNAEMTNLCADMPIYKVAKAGLDLTGTPKITNSSAIANVPNTPFQVVYLAVIGSDSSCKLFNRSDVRFLSQGSDCSHWLPMFWLAVVISLAFVHTFKISFKVT